MFSHTCTGQTTQNKTFHYYRDAPDTSPPTHLILTPPTPPSHPQRRKPNAPPRPIPKTRPPPPPLPGLKQHLHIDLRARIRPIRNTIVHKNLTPPIILKENRIRIPRSNIAARRRVLYLAPVRAQDSKILTIPIIREAVEWVLIKRIHDIVGRAGGVKCTRRGGKLCSRCLYAKEN